MRSRERYTSRPWLQRGLLAALATTSAVGCGSKERTTAAASGQSEKNTSGSATTNGYVALARGVHPLARPEFDLGRLDPNKRIENLSLVFKLSPKKLNDRDSLVAAVSDPKSPQFRQWLTPESYAARFGATADDVALARAWLTAQGLEVHSTPSRLGARLNFGGTVGKLEAAFRSEIHRYQIGAETHYAMASAPSIPADLAEIVLAVHNTHDFFPRPIKRSVRARPQSLCPNGEPGIYCIQDDAGSGLEGIAPPDWASIYDINNLYNTGIQGTKINGEGVTIAVVGTTEISQSDLTYFRTLYGLPSNDITQTLVPDTGAAGPVGGGTGEEAVLDTEWAGAVAPNATINYVFTGLNDANVGAYDQNVDEATYYAIEQNYGAVLSQSYAICESELTPSDADVVEVFGSAANLLGITFLAPAGDTGAAGCASFAATGTGGLYVDLPAAFPGVTSVGGTGFAFPSGLSFDPTTNIATGYPVPPAPPEAVWQEGTGGAGGGGGISVVFSRPSYQSSIPTCSPTGSLPVSGIMASSMREVPDVALTAASGFSQYGYFVACTPDATLQDCSPTGGAPQILEVGGTSAATPSFAGIVALANQAVGQRLGNINPLLYALPETAFHDITTGNNLVPSLGGTDPRCPAANGATGEYGYQAATGYDCASGLGSVDGTNLVTALSGLAPTSIALAPITASALVEGTPVNLSATLTATGGSVAVGGSVTFAFQSYLANDAPDIYGGSWTLATSPITSGSVMGCSDNQRRDTSRHDQRRSDGERGRIRDLRR